MTMYPRVDDALRRAEVMRFVGQRHTPPNFLEVVRLIDETPLDARNMREQLRLMAGWTGEDVGLLDAYGVHRLERYAAEDV